LGGADCFADLEMHRRPPFLHVPFGPCRQYFIELGIQGFFLQLSEDAAGKRNAIGREGDHRNEQAIRPSKAKLPREARPGRLDLAAAFFPDGGIRRGVADRNRL